jgi:lipoprotein-releasing system ATP-binding protein
LSDDGGALVQEAGLDGAILVGRGLVKRFHDGEVETEVLKGLDLELRPGELLALMGPSGSGKSTLLHILGTLLRPTAGMVEIVGREVTDLDERELTRFRNRHLGFVFQFHHLLPDFTALENVLFPAWASRSMDPDEARDRAGELLDRVGLSPKRDSKASQLSGGQKQRVAVARAVMMDPDVVLADEPTGNLDRETSEEVLDLLREMSRRQRKTAFLLSTHDEDVARRCDRLLHIVDGRLDDEVPVGLRDVFGDTAGGTDSDA